MVTTAKILLRPRGRRQGSERGSLPAQWPSVTRLGNREASPHTERAGAVTVPRVHGWGEAKAISRGHGRQAEGCLGAERTSRALRPRAEQKEGSCHSHS